ncbi:hypothetical protein V5N11_012545 [Cardamine amara subsp. amara]|uniref:Replication protein A OB domain-containing protein n=1 Tax=Cardamine amara subsp. amara TaxID=228776 RepID=A0ABD1A397_CARAN
MYRTTSHPYRIGFLPHTKIRNCDDLPAHLDGFNPVKFLEILDGTLNDDYLVDVIGQLMSITHAEDVPVNGKDTKRVSVELRDENDVRLPVVLWGSFAEYISTNVQTAPGSVVICVIKYGKIKVWKGIL